MGGRDPANLIAPGFRFHPTDEELVKFYLKRKVCGRAFRFHAIAEADVYKCEPWDLPDKSALKSRDSEWYFFSGLDKKYGHGSKTNRATERGYWKTTGKGRPVHNKLVIVGMKKTLVYHIGRAPRGERTNWVMHEYRLADSEVEKAGVAQASFVVCKIFQKSGPGPKNGEQHGAPFIEEEWEDEEEVLVTGEQAQAEALIADGAYIETNDLDQLIDFNVSPGNYLPQTNYYHGDSSNRNEDSREFYEDGQKPFVGALENHYDSKLQVSEQQGFDELKPYDVEGKLPVVEYSAKPDEIASHDVNYLLDEPYFDVTKYTMKAYIWRLMIFSIRLKQIPLPLTCFMSTLQILMQMMRSSTRPLTILHVGGNQFSTGYCPQACERRKAKNGHGV